MTALHSGGGRQPHCWWKSFDEEKRAVVFLAVATRKVKSAMPKPGQALFPKCVCAHSTHLTHTRACNRNEAGVPRSLVWEVVASRSLDLLTRTLYLPRDIHWFLRTSPQNTPGKRWPVLHEAPRTATHWQVITAVSTHRTPAWLRGISACPGVLRTVNKTLKKPKSFPQIYHLQVKTVARGKWGHWVSSSTPQKIVS